MVAGDDGWFSRGEVMAIQSRASIKAIILCAHKCYMQYRKVYEYIHRRPIILLEQNNHLNDKFVSIKIVLEVFITKANLLNGLRNNS